VIIVVMGVSGSGKTTLGQALADQLGWPFIEADDFHPQANVTKMRSGQPLDERDRAPWLAAVHAQLFKFASSGRDAVLACSALKAAHRAVLAADIDAIHFVYLDGDAELIDKRLRQRPAHFMPARLLGSQFAALEPPGDALEVPIDLPTTVQVQRVIDALIDSRR
jgi:gluconokinase